MTNWIELLSLVLFAGSWFIASLAWRRGQWSIKVFARGCAILIGVLLALILALDLGGLRKEANVAGIIVVAAGLCLGACAIGFLQWLMHYYHKYFQARKA